LLGAQEIARLEQIAFTGETRGEPEQPGQRALRSVNEHDVPRYVEGPTTG
jgi:hypothetical protein